MNLIDLVTWPPLHNWVNWLIIHCATSSFCFLSSRRFQFARFGFGGFWIISFVSSFDVCFIYNFFFIIRNELLIFFSGFFFDFFDDFKLISVVHLECFDMVILRWSLGWFSAISDWFRQSILVVQPVSVWVSCLFLWLNRNFDGCLFFVCFSSSFIYFICLFIFGWFGSTWGHFWKRLLSRFSSGEILLFYVRLILVFILANCKHLIGEFSHSSEKFESLSFSRCLTLVSSC